jgi:putative ABC transport system substrate-binding protein
MRRREFIALLGATASAAWPLVAQAQQPARRIGVLTPGASDDPEMQSRLAAFLAGLQQLGWTDGHNVRIDARWASGDAVPDRAKELVALAIRHREGLPPASRWAQSL